MDTLAPDASCMIGVTAAELNGPAPIPRLTPAHWFDSPDESQMAALNDTIGVDGRIMAAIGICGDEVGRFMSLVAEDGIPFTFKYANITSPFLIDNDHTIINNRPQNAFAVHAADGKAGVVVAGKGRFGHSPPTMDDMGNVLAFHDADEGAFLRFRFHDVVQDGKRLLVATGTVLPSIMEDGKPRDTTWADLDQLRNVEVSPEFMRIDDQLVYVALSLVNLGNTNTSLADPDELMAASIRVIRAEGEEEVTTEEEPEQQIEVTADDTERLPVNIEISPEQLEALGYVKKEPEVPELTPEQQERQELVALADIDLDLTPLGDLEHASIGDSNLGRLIVSKHDPTKEGRIDFYKRVGKAAGRHYQTIRQMVNDQVHCPPLATLEGVSRALSGVSTEQLVSAAKRDGCQRYK